MLHGKTKHQIHHCFYSFIIKITEQNIPKLNKGNIVQSFKGLLIQKKRAEGYQEKSYKKSETRV